MPDASRGGEELAALARALLAQNILRRKLFAGFVAQPSWGLLLCLYIARLERTEITAEALCAASGESLPAVKHLLNEMERHGFVTLCSAKDARSVLAEITAEAASTLEQFLQDLVAGVHLRDASEPAPPC